MGGRAAYVAGYGVYVPRGRVDTEVFKTLYTKGLPAKVKSISMAEADEDSLTMGYEAAKGLIGDRKVEGMILASNSLPYGHKKGASLLAKMLRLDWAMPCYDLTGGPLAAAEALSLAATLVRGGSMDCMLVVVSEHPRYRPGEEVEMAWGAGAAAFLVASKGFARVEDIRVDYEVESYDLWTLRGEESLRYRPEMLDSNFEQAMARLVEAVGGAEGLSSYRFLALQLTRSRWTRSLVKQGLKAEQWESVSSLSQVGNLGSATFGVNLALALDQCTSGDRVLAVGYGHGNSVSMFLAVAEDPPRSGVAEKLSAGVPVDLATYWQTVFQRRFSS